MCEFIKSITKNKINLIDSKNKKIKKKYKL